MIGRLKFEKKIKKINIKFDNIIQLINFAVH